MNRLKKSTIYKIIINFHFIIMFLNTCATSQVALSALQAVKPLPLPQEGLANHEVISLNDEKVLWNIFTSFNSPFHSLHVQLIHFAK